MSSGIPKTMWRADTKLWKAVRVECPEGLYPATDAAGEKIFINTHFETETEAWDRLADEAAAWVSMAGRDITRAEQDLLKAQQEAGEACKKFKEYYENREKAE